MGYGVGFCVGWGGGIFLVEEDFVGCLICFIGLLVMLV